jgi:predicted acylesterase/phospholipase RssA
MSIDTLCFSGGGIQGLSFIGSLLYLEKKKYIKLQDITTFIGTSCGAILSLLVLINTNINDIILLLLENFKYLDIDCNIDNIFENYGINDGHIFEKILSLELQNKFNKSNITFLELYKLTNKKLIIIGTNFTLSKEEIFSYEKTPNIPIIIAIRISISIPLIFTPVLLNNNYYVDGALVNNFPINYCNPETTLGFKICDFKKLNINSIQDIIFGSIYIMMQSQYNNINNYNYIEINFIDNGLCNFNIDKKDIYKFINNGKQSAKKYLKNIYEKKINILKNKITDYNDKIIIKQVLNNIIEKIINF